jgi:hypothetical protein
LGKSDSPYDVGAMGGGAPVVMSTLSDANAFLTMLPVTIVRAPADVVRAVLKLLVPQPHGSSIGAALDDPSRRLDNAVSARPSFAQPKCLADDAAEKFDEPSRNLGADTVEPVAQAIGSPIAERSDIVLLDRQAPPAFGQTRAEQRHDEPAGDGRVERILKGHGIDRARLGQQWVAMLDGVMSRIQGMVGHLHELLDRVAYRLDAALHRGEHSD